MHHQGQTQHSIIQLPVTSSYEYADTYNQLQDHLQLYQFSTSETGMDSLDNNEISTSNQTNIVVVTEPAVQQTKNKKQTINTVAVDPSIAIEGSVVPTLSNVDEIFQLLSHKIAKYCQILADLTNCEVFYKAQLPSNESIPASTKKSKSSNDRIKSLYWGTHKMLFQFSHNQGIKFDKANGDCLIKVNQRSLSSDVNNLIEEILNEPSLNLKQIESLTQVNDNPNKNKITTVQIDNTVEMIQPQHRPVQTENNNDKDKLLIRDCRVYLDRLNDDLFDEYLNKFEYKTQESGILNDNPNHIDNNCLCIDDEFDLNLNYYLKLPDDRELYSDDFKLLNKSRNKNKKLKKNKSKTSKNACGPWSSSTSISSDNEAYDDDEDDDEEDDDDDEDEDEDERVLLGKNCFNVNDEDEQFYENEDDFKCDCCNVSFRHLTQFKVTLKKFFSTET